MQSSEFVSWLTLKIKFKKIKELLKATEIDLHWEVFEKKGDSEGLR